MLNKQESEKITEMLANNAFLHIIASIKDSSSHGKNDDSSARSKDVPFCFTFIVNDRYNDSDFKGLLIDSGVATHSTEGTGQLAALQKFDKSIKLDKSKERAISVVFEIEATSSIGAVYLKTSLGTMYFHIVNVNTSFLLCLKDINRLKAMFDNIVNQIVQSNAKHSIIRCYDHVFLL